MELFPKDVINEIALRLSYGDLINTALTQKNIYHKLRNIWCQKGQQEYPDLYDYWRQKAPFAALSDHQYYLWLYSQDNVTYGSEKFKTLSLCLTRAIKLGDANLIHYFQSKGATYDYNSLKALGEKGKLEIIKTQEVLIKSLSLNELSRIFMKAGQYGRNEIIEYLLKINGGQESHVYQCFILYGAIKGNQEHLFKHEQLNCEDIIPELIYYSARQNNLPHLIKYLTYDDIDDICIIEAIRGAIKGKHILLYQNIINHQEEFSKFPYNLPPISNYLDVLIVSRNIELFRDLYDKYVDEIDFYTLNQCIYFAFRYGQHEIIEHLLSSTLMTNFLGSGQDLFGWFKLTGYRIRKNHWQVLRSISQPQFFAFVSNLRTRLYNFNKMAKYGHKDFLLYFFEQNDTQN